ncbi:MAG: DUF3800 domain-containing protein [Treponema sp.]|nr:DUF3800 domain-containing protein [Spirochaetia bacterium]MDY4131444.1 DUF3800 domain-containing protein [Treponema sp.]
MEKDLQNKIYFYFDESGDPNILGHHGVNLLKEGKVSKTFSVGFISTRNPHDIQSKLENLRRELLADETLKAVPSISNLKNGFHANKDCAEVRREVFKLLKTLDFETYIIVAKKDEDLFRQKFNMNKKRIYKYLVTELVKDHIKNQNQIEMYFASMTGIVSPGTMQEAIDSALKAIYKENETQSKINIYVQQPSHTPLLQVVDYVLWTIFRFYEKGETRYMDFMKDKIKIVNDIFAKELEGKKNEACGG